MSKLFYFLYFGVSTLFLFNQLFGLIIFVELLTEQSKLIRIFEKEKIAS